MKKLIAVLLVVVFLTSVGYARFLPPFRIYRDPCTGWNDYYDYGMGYAVRIPGPWPTRDYLSRAKTHGEKLIDTRVDIVDGSSVVAIARIQLMDETGASSMGIDHINDQFLAGEMTYSMSNERYSYATEYNEFVEYPDGILQAFSWGGFSADLNLTIVQDLGDHTNTVSIVQPYYNTVVELLQEYQIVNPLP